MKQLNLFLLLLVSFMLIDSARAEIFETGMIGGAYDTWLINDDLETVTLIEHTQARNGFGNINLTSATNPNDNKTYTVTGIGDGRNVICWVKQDEIEIPENILRINDNAFSRLAAMPRIPSVTIPKGNKLTYIGNNAISRSKYMWINSDCDVRNIGSHTPTFVHIENRVSIGEEGGALFLGYREETIIEVDAELPPTVLGDIFVIYNPNYNQYELTTLYVPVGCVETYRNDPKWGLFTNILEIAPAAIEDAVEDTTAFGVSAAERNIIITTSDSSSHVTAEIYTPAGLLVKSSSLSATSTSIPVSAGLYIVHIGANNTYKVAVH